MHSNSKAPLSPLGTLARAVCPGVRGRGTVHAHWECTCCRPKTLQGDNRTITVSFVNIRVQDADADSQVLIIQSQSLSAEASLACYDTCPVEREADPRFFDGYSINRSIK